MRNIIAGLLEIVIMIVVMVSSFILITSVGMILGIGGWQILGFTILILVTEFVFGIMKAIKTILTGK